MITNKIKLERGFSVWFVILQLELGFPVCDQCSKTMLAFNRFIFFLEANARLGLPIAESSSLKADMINLLCLKFTRKIKLESDFSLCFLSQ